MSKKNVLAKKASEPITPASYDYGAHAGKGFEHQTREDVAIPFLAILQSNSPQVDSIAEAKAGMLFNTVSEQVMDTALVLPVTTQHVYVEWIPRADGGGFVGVHKLEDPTVAAAKASATEFGKYKMPNGHDLVETFYIYVVLCDDKEVIGFAVMTFSSTKIKVYKRANTRWQTFMLMKDDGTKIRPPMFGHLTRVGTVQQENRKGKFYNYTLEPADGDLRSSMLPPTDSRFRAAAEFHELINKGTIRIAYESVQQPSEAEDTDGDAPF